MREKSFCADIFLKNTLITKSFPYIPHERYRATYEEFTILLIFLTKNIPYFNPSINICWVWVLFTSYEKKQL